MKRIICAVLLAVSVLGLTSVNAMTKEELKAKLTSTYEVNGVKFKATDSQIVQIERYINTNNISDYDAEFISKKIDEAVAIVEKGNATSLSELTGKEKEALISLVNDITTQTDIKLTVEDGVINVYNLDGTLFTKIDSIVKYTNESKLLIVLASTVTAIGLLTLVAKMRKASA